MLGVPGVAQDRESLAGEGAAQALKRSAQAEADRFNIRYGPLALQLGAGVRAGYTDNVFYSQTNRVDDFIINPEVNLTGFMQVSELNTLRLSVGVGYEYYFDNSALNADSPMINPDSELVFNIFAGDFRIRLHERFTYQETLFYNTSPSGQNLLYNFNNAGIFSRWDNRAGLDVDWDLNKVILSAGYDHENFESSTSGFEYLNRASEWFTASAALFVGDHARAGVESRAGLHNYDTETTLNDHWQVRAGPFAEFTLPEQFSFRAGGGYDTAQYDAAGDDSDFQSYYAYGRLSQEMRFGTHALAAGHETLLGDNANNMRTTYVRYSISSPVVEHVELGASAAVHFNKEFGGAFTEEFTYYVIGLRAGFQFHKYWRADLGYEFIQKFSDLPDRDYYRNRVTVGVTFTF